MSASKMSFYTHSKAGVMVHQFYHSLWVEEILQSLCPLTDKGHNRVSVSLSHSFPLSNFNGKSIKDLTFVFDMFLNKVFLIFCITLFF